MMLPRLDRGAVFCRCRHAFMDRRSRGQVVFLAAIEALTAPIGEVEKRLSALTVGNSPNQFGCALRSQGRLFIGATSGGVNSAREQVGQSASWVRQMLGQLDLPDKPVGT